MQYLHMTLCRSEPKPHYRISSRDSGYMQAERRHQSSPICEDYILPTSKHRKLDAA